MQIFFPLLGGRIVKFDSAANGDEVYLDISMCLFKIKLRQDRNIWKNFNGKVSIAQSLRSMLCRVRSTNTSVTTVKCRSHVSKETDETNEYLDTHLLVRVKQLLLQEKFIFSAFVQIEISEKCNGY